MSRSQEIEQRMHKVRLLLSSLDDYVPGPKVTSLGNESGPAPSKLVPCECHTIPCHVCNDTKWRRRQKDEPAWDEYLEQRVDEAIEPQLFSGVDHAAEIRRLDASIARIRRTLMAKAGVLDKREKFSWEAAREQQERYGSYRELRKWLRVLALKWPEGHRAIRRVHLSNIEVKLTELDRTHEDVAVYWLQHQMKSLRVPPWLMEYDASRRRDSVQSLHARGLNPGAIARRTGIRKEKVKRILKGLAAAS